MTVEQDSEFIDAVDQFVFVENVEHRPAVSTVAEHFVQRQNRVICRR